MSTLVPRPDVGDDDSWSSERFESQITAATIALYETEVDRESATCNHVHKFTVAELGQMQQRGILIPAPGRIVIDGPMSILKWPDSGCVGLGANYNKPGEDLMESYCNLYYFRRINRLPGHSAMTAIGTPYQLLRAWPQDKGPVIGITDYLTVNHRTGVVSVTKRPWDKGRADLPDVVRAQTSSLSFAIQYTEDARHTWSITAHNSVSKVSVGAYPECVKSLLYARSLPMTPSGRKRPILHLVSAHQRRMKSGIDIDVRQFLRGVMQVTMDDVRYTVQAPAALIEEMSAKVATA